VRTHGRAGRWERLRFEQRDVAQAAAEAGADLLFMPVPAAPLRSPIPVVALLRRAPGPRSRAFPERLRAMLAAAGVSGAALRLAWADQPTHADEGAPLRRLTPPVSPAFRPLEAPAMGPRYVLAHVALEGAAAPLLAAWTWVEAGMGGAVELWVCGEATEQVLAERARGLGLESVRFRALRDAGELPGLYRQAEAVLSPGEGAGWDLRWALASGTPVAAVGTPLAVAVVGPAGYLAAAGDTRALGAACLTLLVEDSLAQSLRARGLERAESLQGDAPLRALWAAFAEGAGRGPG
jgi:hypothetical protein